MHPLLIDNNRSNPASVQLKTVLTNPLWHLYPPSKRLLNLSVTVSADCMISSSHLATGHPEKPLIRSHSPWEDGDNNRSGRMAVTHETHPNRSIYRDPFWDHCPFCWYQNGNEGEGGEGGKGGSHLALMYIMKDNVCIIIRHGEAACSFSA